MEALQDAGPWVLRAVTLVLELALAGTLASLAAQCAPASHTGAYVALVIGLNPFLAAAATGGGASTVLYLALALFVLCIRSGAWRRGPAGEGPCWGGSLPTPQMAGHFVSHARPSCSRASGRGRRVAGRGRVPFAALHRARGTLPVRRASDGVVFYMKLMLSLSLPQLVGPCLARGRWRFAAAALTATAALHWTSWYLFGPSYLASVYGAL